MSDAYEKVSFRGATFDRMTAQALSKMEEKLGYSLTVLQGSYSQGPLSAGTHAGGGAVDLAATDHDRKVRVGRDIGWAMWYRTPSEGPWQAHVHGILIGNERVDPAAGRQITHYRNGLNGLASMLKDTFWYRPNPIPTYKYVVDKLYGITLHGLRVDFINAIDGGKNPARWRGKVVQRLLNKKNKAGLVVDGVIGMKTVAAWRNWEKKVGIVGRYGVPDRTTLSKLFRWTIYYIK